MSDTIRNIYRKVLADAIANGRGYTTTIEIDNIHPIVDVVTEIGYPCKAKFVFIKDCPRVLFIMEYLCTEHSLSSSAPAPIAKSVPDLT